MKKRNRSGLVFQSYDTLFRDTPPYFKLCKLFNNKFTNFQMGLRNFTKRQIKKQK